VIDARTCLAKAIAAEMDGDMSPEFLAAADKILLVLWLNGYALLPIHDDTMEAA
jgi:hypothetical protein